MTRRSFLKFISVSGAAFAIVPILDKLILPSTQCIVDDTGTKHILSSSFNQMFKEVYAGKVQDTVYKNNPFLTIISKVPILGIPHHIPIPKLDKL